MKLEELARAVAKAERDRLSTRRQGVAPWYSLTPNDQEWETKAAADTLRALLAVLPSVGWQLVPVEATDEQHEAGYIDKEDVCTRDIWRAMLAAAPKLED